MEGLNLYFILKFSGVIKELLGIKEKQKSASALRLLEGCVRSIIPGCNFEVFESAGNSDVYVYSHSIQVEDSQVGPALLDIKS